MARYICTVCDTIYDEEKDGVKWEDLPDSWVCLVCESGKAYYKVSAAGAGSDPLAGAIVDADGYSDESPRTSDIEVHMADIHAISETGESITEPMRTRTPTFSWDELLVMGAQLAKMPLNPDEPVNSRTVIGPEAKDPLVIETPIYITHMSFGALSREAKTALAKGSAS